MLSAMSEWSKNPDRPLLHFLPFAVLIIIASLITNYVSDMISGGQKITDSTKIITVIPEQPTISPAFTTVPEQPTISPTFTPIPTATEIPPEEEMIPIAYEGLYAPASDFLFPYSSQELLSFEQLDQLMGACNDKKKRSLSQLAINEIFARHGYTFIKQTQTAKEARSKFEGKDWYEMAKKLCTVEKGDQDALLEELNYFELENVNAINNWQDINRVSNRYGYE